MLTTDSSEIPDNINITSEALVKTNRHTNRSSIRDSLVKKSFAEVSFRRSIIIGVGSTLPSLQHNNEGLSTFGGALAIISTILGGGIVGLPYAIYLLGLPLGVALNLAVDYMSYESGMMYMALKNLMPDSPDSLYEIGFMLLGRKSIFANALTVVVMGFCLMLIYLIVLSTTCASLVGGFAGNMDVWYA